MAFTNLSLSLITAQAGALHASLQLQPNAGTEAQRTGWIAALARSISLAQSPVGPVAGLFFGESWNLDRAKGLLDRVASQTQEAGILLADPREGFAANAGRFASAEVFVIRPGSIRKEGVHDKADRLATALFNSKVPRLQTVAQILDRAFAAHIRKLDDRVAMLPEIVVGVELPEDIAYPRYFEHAHPRLMEYLREVLVYLNDGREIPWVECQRETIGILIEREEARQGINAKTSLNSEVRQRGTALTMQIPDYSALQLFCLLRQIHEGKVSTDLIDDLRRARNGRTLALEDAESAGVRWRDLLRASELIGAIDVIHANIDVAYELALSEQPNVEPGIVRLQVRAAVARLRKLDENPTAGRVIPLRRG